MDKYTKLVEAVHLKKDIPKFNVGDTIDVMVLDFDKENSRVSLGLKQKTQNPWEVVDTKYAVGSRVKGSVVNLVPYGAFVELEKGVEGLLHSYFTRRMDPLESAHIDLPLLR